MQPTKNIAGNPAAQPVPNPTWISIFGQFDVTDNEIIFRGYTFTPKAPKRDGQPPSTEPVEAPLDLEPRGGVGRVISNQRLTDGTVSVEIEFETVDLLTTAEVILHDDAANDELLNVGLGADGLLLNVRHWRSAETQQPLGTKGAKSWHTLRSIGERRQLVARRRYELSMNVQGSYITVTLNGVEIGSGPLPFSLRGMQLGLFAQSRSDIHFRDFSVEPKRPLAFVVMQFEPPEYEELFNDVIAPVCGRMGLQAFRANQADYPGIVIADIQRQIRASRVVIAEITPVNPNVFYEVGYADAIDKPVILIADRHKLAKLPFDVSAFRTIFYENTIGGKGKVETTLVAFLQNILSVG